MKKLLLLGAMLIVGATSMANITILDKASTGETYSGTGYLPITSTGEIINVNNKVYLKILPVSNIAPDGSSLLLDFGKMKAGEKKTVVGKFTAQVFKGGASGAETVQKIDNTKLKYGFDKGTGEADSNIDKNTQANSTISLAVTSGTGTGVAKDMGDIDYTLTGTFEGETKFIGTVQAVATIEKGGLADEENNVGTFIDRTKNVAIVIKDLTVGSVGGP